MKRILMLSAFISSPFAQAQTTMTPTGTEDAPAAETAASTETATGTTTASATTSERDGESYRCTLDNLTREIRVVYEDANLAIPCRVDYQKEAEGGGTIQLWRADNLTGYCEEKISYFVNDKLAASGWTCAKL